MAVLENIIIMGYPLLLQIHKAEPMIYNPHPCPSALAEFTPVRGPTINVSDGRILNLKRQSETHRSGG